MEVKIILRKFWKLLLISLIFIIIQLAIQLFSLELMLDYMGINSILETYVTVGTIYETGIKNSAFKKIPPNVISLLEESELIRSLETRETVSGKITGLENVPAVFAVDQTNHFIVFTAKAINDSEVSEFTGNLHMRRVNLEVEKIYVGQSNWLKQGDLISLGILWDGEDVYELKNEQRCLIIGKSAFSDGLGMLGQLIYSFNLSEEQIQYLQISPETAEFYKSTFIPIESEMKNKELDELVELEISNRGLKKYIKEIEFLDDVYRIRKVQNMEMLIPIVNEKMFYTQGRGINKSDIGKKVCVISNKLAMLHNLKLGDKLKISTTETHYDIDGFESGYPKIGQFSTLEYSKPEEYEIIGVYSFLKYNPGEGTLFFGYNDIFIPKETEGIINNSNIKPSTFSFSIKGEDYYQFIDTIVPKLTEEGYSVHLSSSRWEEVEHIYRSLQNRRIISIVNIIGITILGAIIYVLILMSLYKREFAIRELFGTPFNIGSRAYTVPFGISSVIAILISTITAYRIYNSRLIKQISDIVRMALPNEKQVIIIITVAGIIPIIISFIILITLAKKSRQKSVIKLLK